MANAQARREFGAFDVCAGDSLRYGIFVAFGFVGDCCVGVGY